MKHFLYLAVDLGALLIPFLFSFHPRILFYRHWRAFIIANALTAVPFLLADHYFTQIGVWGFNPDYVMGYYWGALPLEEWLFFFCIPYASVFTFHCLTLFIASFPKDESYRKLLLFLSLGLSLTGFWFHELWYTASTSIACGFVLLFLLMFTKFRLVRFLLIYMVLLLPFFVCNGILTGTGLSAPVVWYNNAENLHWRVLTIPVEDFVYGFLLLLLNVFIYERCLTPSTSKQ